MAERCKTFTAFITRIRRSIKRIQDREMSDEEKSEFYPPTVISDRPKLAPGAFTGSKKSNKKTNASNRKKIFFGGNHPYEPN